MSAGPDRAPVVLLGPQRQHPTVDRAVADLGVDGPLVTVTAGWEEREREDAELAQHLGRQAQNLGLFPRAEDIYRQDPAVRGLHHELLDRRRELQTLYRLRLRPQLEVCRALFERTDPADPDRLHGPEIDSAIEGLRTLDRHHLGRVEALETEIDARLGEVERPALARHRLELARMIEGARGVLVAGGNVATLLWLLRLFRVIEVAAGKPMVAWSGGAMVMSERVVLFHDSPPQGSGDAEVYGPGFGLATGVIPLPHARHRLRLDDPARVALLARRLQPDLCVALDYGGRIDRDDPGRGWSPSGGAAVLEPGGTVATSDGRPGPTSTPPTSTPPTSTPPTSNPPTSTPADPAAVEIGGTAPSAETGAEVIASLEAAASQSPAAVDRLLNDVGFPTVGRGWAVFAYRGRAGQVRLRHWLSGMPSEQPFRRLAGSDLWVLEMELQERARIEYKLEVVDGPRHDLIRDPLNTAVANDPFGANSVVQGIDYSTPPWTIEQETTRRGTVEEATVASRAFGHDRPYSVYLPARFRTTRRYPLLVVHDGPDYARYANLIEVLDNLIHRLEIPPLIAALIPSSDRTTEYVADDRHARFVVEELLVDLERNLPLLPDSADRGLMGASLGGVASLHTAWSNPGRFDRLLLQSGSFAFTDIGDHDLGPIFDPVVSFVNRFRKEPGRPADRIFLSAGIYESLIYFNRSLLPVFQRTGARVRMVEAQDGHNWQNWRDQLRDGLTWLFPGPLLMDYE